MFPDLKNHPFAVEAFFDYSLVLTFAVPQGELRRLVPEPLELDSFQDTWAFVAVALVQTRHLRPKGFPAWMGNDFFLIGYRIFVRYTNKEGRRLRGLYILKSETDKMKMQYLGNLFTHYQYATTDIHIHTTPQSKNIQSKKSGLNISVGTTHHSPLISHHASLIPQNVALPASSPFGDWKEARRFAGPLPFTFTVLPEQKSVLIVEGVRQNWQPQPVQILDYDIDFMKNLGVTEYHLANAFEIQNIPYYWKKGKLESWA